MAEQLKDLASRLKNIGGIQNLDSGKKKVNPETGANVDQDGPTMPINEFVASDVEASTETAAGSDVVLLSRKRTRGDSGTSDDDAGESGAAVKKATVEPVPDAPVPRNLKQWISSLPPEDRRRELFELCICS